MGKRALSILLVAAVVLSLGITWTAAEGNAEGWHYENGVLILKDYCGDFNEDLIGEDLIVVVEGEVTMTSTVSGKNVLLVVLPGSDLTISAETGGCVKADNALLLTGDSGTLEMESKDPATQPWYRVRCIPLVPVMSRCPPKLRSVFRQTLWCFSRMVRWKSPQQRQR